MTANFQNGSYSSEPEISMVARVALLLERNVPLTVAVIRIFQSITVCLVQP